MMTDTSLTIPTLPIDIPDDVKMYRIDTFSADDYCDSSARRCLEDNYYPLLHVSPTVNRRSASFQFNKRARVHNWLKYKEGFSADLVDRLLDDFGIEAGDTVLDPFVGSGTTCLVAKMRGINSVGIDPLPISKIAISAKQPILDYSLSELRDMHEALATLKVPSGYRGRVHSIPITEGAYSDQTDRALAYVLEWLVTSRFSVEANNLLLLCMINSLERLGYTRKDGQYLRWDYRSDKVVEASRRRIENGRAPAVTILDKGDLPDAIATIISEFDAMLSDIEYVQGHSPNSPSANIEFVEGSALTQLPKLKSDSIDGVITSPPYCNRYDYTRTYALELAFLGLDNDAVKGLRQMLLSATVENKSKLGDIEAYYSSIGRLNDYDHVVEAITGCSAFRETVDALNLRAKNGEINNVGVLRMVEGYITELTFIYAELFRVCKPGASVAFVNDNVRYGGEVVPIDYISTALAEALGFIPIKIISLKQQKGNSSQQMKRYGRMPLRKSITIWQRP